MSENTKMNKKIIQCLNKDRKLRKIIPTLKVQVPDNKRSVYESLIRTIIFQQLAGSAAEAIFTRFTKAYRKKIPSPRILAKADIEKLRSLGLSRQKANYVRNVAAFWQERKLKNQDWSKLTNEEIVKMLSQIKGVGNWTVEIILMFTLNRYEVFPTGDYGIQMAMKKLYKIKEEKKELKIKMLQLSKKWAPYQAIACLYLWAWWDEN